MTILWKSAYEIGHEKIDAEHQQLFELINRFLAAEGQGALTMCAMSLFKYTREHFTHEEGLMRDIGYPSIREHIQQHNDLLSELNHIAESIANNTLDKSQLSAFLVPWLLNHIGKSDAELAGYLRLKEA